MSGSQSVVSERGQGKLSDSAVVKVVAEVTVTHHQGVLLAQLVVQAWADRCAPPRRDHGSAKRDNRQAGVQDGRVDNRVVVDCPALDIKKEGRFFVDRAAEIASESLDW